MNRNKKNTRAKRMPPLLVNPARRMFIRQSSALAVMSLFPISAVLKETDHGAPSCLVNEIGFSGARKSLVTGCYELGNGYRIYNPRLMRFNTADSMSPFGRGGINSYSYCMGNPVNRRDPSGHAFITLIIGAIVGALVGAGISLVTEGVRSAVSGDDLDWKQVGIGAALGFISGGFGAAALGLKTGVKVGLAVADTLISASADFGFNLAIGVPIKRAGINAGVGAAIGLTSFGVGQGLGRVAKLISSSQKGVTHAGRNLASPLDESLRLVGTTRQGFYMDLPNQPNTRYYRGDNFPLDLPDTYPDLDARLSNIIQHTSRTSGSAGLVQSFSSSLSVASRFANNRGAAVTSVSSSEGMFMSAGQIFYMHGDRLVRSGRVRGGTLAAAISKFYEHQESEYFWMGRL